MIVEVAPDKPGGWGAVSRSSRLFLDCSSIVLRLFFDCCSISRRVLRGYPRPPRSGSAEPVPAFDSADLSGTQMRSQSIGVSEKAENRADPTRIEHLGAMTRDQTGIQAILS